MGNIRKKGKNFFILAALACVFLSGCAAPQEKENLSISGFAFDTTYTITLYKGGSKDVLDACVSKCSEYEKVFSRTLKDSELYQINEIEKIYKKVVEENREYKSQWEHKKIQYDKDGLAFLSAAIEAGKPEGNVAEYKLHEDGRITFPVSEMMEEILGKGLEYSEKSKGGFDLAIEPVTSLWDFKAEEPEAPAKEEIRKALKYVDYRKVTLRDGELAFSMPGMGIDLGGIAKGFIADDLKKYLLGQGVKGALINLGGNVLCIGGKEDGKPFYVGIQQPFAQRSQTIAAVAVKDVSVVSSGIYERYFKTEDGAMYHHIINPVTGYPYKNDLLGVTILSENSVDGDGLSTACFALGREKGIEYINSLEGVYAVFITEDEKLWYSDGFEQFLKEGESG